MCMWCAVSTHDSRYNGLLIFNTKRANHKFMSLVAAYSPLLPNMRLYEMKFEVMFNVLFMCLLNMGMRKVFNRQALKFFRLIEDEA